MQNENIERWLNEFTFWKMVIAGVVFIGINFAGMYYTTMYHIENEYIHLSKDSQHLLTEILKKESEYLYSPGERARLDSRLVQLEKRIDNLKTDVILNPKAPDKKTIELIVAEVLRQLK